MIQTKITLHLLGPALKENIEQVQRTKNRTLWETLRDISKNDCEERWLKTSRRSSQSSVSVTQNFLSCRPLFRQHTAGDLASLCQVAWKPGYDSSPSSVFLTSLPLRGYRVKLINHNLERFMSFCLCWHQGLSTCPFLCSLLPFY